MSEVSVEREASQKRGIIVEREASSFMKAFIIAYPALRVSQIQVSGKYFRTLTFSLLLIVLRGSPDNFLDENAFIEMSESTVSGLNMIPGDAR